MKRILFLFLALTVTFLSNAQFNGEKCGASATHQKLFNGSLKYRTNFQQAQEQARFAIQTGQVNSTRAVVTIPVVFHVMHTGEPEGTGTNISREQILSALESLNDGFRGNAPFNSSGVDMEINFCLAARDPSGNPTSGINRVDASSITNYSTNGIESSNEIALKALSNWPNTDYYNVWIVSEIEDNDGGGGTQGYAYFPGAGDAVDGTVILYNALGYDPNGDRCFDVKSYTAHNAVFIHELGHGFGLFHTFEGDGDGTVCPTNTDCNTDGDQCCDTPPHERTAGGCPTGTFNNCGTLRDAHIHNFMDYSSGDCQTEFTSDQKTRVQGFLATSRLSLTTSNGCTPVDAPIADFTTECAGASVTGCKGSFIQFYDLSDHNPTSWSWSFSGGTPSTSTNQNPQVTYNTAGTYAVALTATNGVGAGATVTKTGYITIYDTATTACENGIQNSGYFGYAISGVTIANINNTTSPLTNGYEDYSCGLTTCVTEGQMYPIDITIDNLGGSQDGVYAVFIDYDDDGVFADPAERVISGTTPFGSGTVTYSHSITIPTNATETDLLRMRVIHDQFDLSGPCDNLFTGEAEDYGIYISAATSVTTDPLNASVCSGRDTSFSITATNGVGYQWQVDTGTGYFNLSANAIYSGVNTSTLNLTAPDDSFDNNIYRCIVDNGCDQYDTSNTSTLTIGGVINTTDVQTACDSLTWIDGITYYTNNNTAKDTLLGASGCDSVITLDLTINTTWRDTIYQVACDSFVFAGTTYTSTGFYVDSSSTTAGCDSITWLDLTVNYSVRDTIQDTACDSYTYAGSARTVSGTYTDSLMTSLGCDSLVVLELVINYSKKDTIYQTACDSFSFGGDWYMSTGLYNDTIVVDGCDSIVTLDLTINNTWRDTIYQAACDSFVFAGTTYTSTGLYVDSSSTAAGCDSITWLDLTVNYSVRDTIQDTACDSYIYAGSTRTVSGTYTDSLMTSLGCDSLVVLELVINYSKKDTIYQTACDSFSFGGDWYMSTGLYNDTIVVDGCDSIVTLDLTINNTWRDTIYQAACDSFVFAGTTYTSTGLYVDSSSTAAGCDSITWLDLTVNYSVRDTIQDTACDSYIYAGSTRTVSGTYTDSLMTSLGCDSLVVLELVINYSKKDTIYQTACDSFSFGGNWYLSSGLYNDTIIIGGCDSIVTLDLTINNTWIDTIYQTACDSFVFAGTTYTSTGVYVDSSSTAAACDSITWLDLTVNYSLRDTIQDTACNGYTFGGNPIAVSGTYYDTLLSSSNCDSIIVLELIVNSTAGPTLFQSVCDSFVFAGNTLTSTGIYYDTLINTIGCDSVITLDLNIFNSKRDSLTVTACDYYVFNGDTLRVSGSYVDSNVTIAVCDSITWLDLTIIPNIYDTIADTACDSYTFGGQVITASGIYNDTLIATNTCDSIVTLDITIENCTDISTLEALSFNVYPNPTTGMIVVELDGVINEQKLKIYDVNGKQVLSKLVDKNIVEIDLSMMEDGTYIIQWDNGKHVLKKQLIIQH